MKWGGKEILLLVGVLVLLSCGGGVEGSSILSSLFGKENQEGGAGVVGGKVEFEKYTSMFPFYWKEPNCTPRPPIDRYLLMSRRNGGECFVLCVWLLCFSFGLFLIFPFFLFFSFLFFSFLFFSFLFFSFLFFSFFSLSLSFVFFCFSSLLFSLSFLFFSFLFSSFLFFSFLSFLFFSFLFFSIS